MDIKQAQNINLLLLKEFDAFCKKHDIKYRLEAGTFLGAIRHKGFIPWDDDCDIAMLRTEYEKLLSALKNDNFSDGFKYMRVLDYKDDLHFYDFVDRLFYTKTVYREEPKYANYFDGMYQYLWLDIFVLDDTVPSLMKKQYFKLKTIYGLAMAHRYNIDYHKYNLLDKIKIFILTIIGSFLKFKTLYAKYQNQVNSIYENEHYDATKVEKVYYSNYPLPWIDYEIDKKDELELIYVDFEDTKLPIVKNYDKLLTKLFGDYMKLPDIQNQKPAHIDIM